MNLYVNRKDTLSPAHTHKVTPNAPEYLLKCSYTVSSADVLQFEKGHGRKILLQQLEVWSEHSIHMHYHIQEWLVLYSPCRIGQESGSGVAGQRSVPWSCDSQNLLQRHLECKCHKSRWNSFGVTCIKIISHFLLISGNSLVVLQSVIMKPLTSDEGDNSFQPVSVHTKPKCPTNIHCRLCIMNVDCHWML